MNISKENEPIFVTCKGCGIEEYVDSWSQIEYHQWHRTDYYGMSTGHYCDKCFATNYPYRKDVYYDPGYCGERMDDDY